jgi:putative restriction endonuclease
VPEIDDYLRITQAEARAQWRSVAARTPVPAGRQVNFVPVETILCLAASLRVNHRRYGGSTAHLAAEPVPALARLFRRPNSSILAKMANLDGSRSNGAKYEIQLAATLLGSQGWLAATYRTVLAGARDAGIGPDLLPDFLHLEGSDAELVLLGQEGLPDRDVEESVQPMVASWRAKRSDVEEQLTQHLLVAAARIGQHRFSREVLHNHGHRCVFCGLTVELGGVRARRMLVAGHIKPWRSSTSAERLDMRNGLTACPTHDVAFDTGLITVGPGLDIHVKAELRPQIEARPEVRAAFGSPPLAARLLLPEQAESPRGAYLGWHRRHIYGDGDAVPA